MRAKKLILMEKIEEVGFWKTEEEVKAKLQTVADEKEKVKLLALQVQFQKTVLSVTHHEKEVFQLSAKGEKFNSKRLCQNLLQIIKKPDTDVEDAVDENLPLPSRTLRGRNRYIVSKQHSQMERPTKGR